MKYLVSKKGPDGKFHPLAAFVARWQAEKYAEHEALLSGWAYKVELQSETLETLSTFTGMEVEYAEAS